MKLGKLTLAFTLIQNITN